jgi:hypothetical protein
VLQPSLLAASRASILLNLADFAKQSASVAAQIQAHRRRKVNECNRDVSTVSLSLGLYANGFNERPHVGRYFLRTLWSCNLVNHHNRPRWSDT